MINMGTVWDRTTEFLSDNLGAVVPVALLAIFLPLSIRDALAPLSVLSPSTAVTIQIVGLALSILSLWGQLTITALALDPLAGRERAAKAALSRLLPALGISVLLLLAFLVLLMPVPIALAAAGFDFEAAMHGGRTAIPPGVGSFVALYCLVFVVVALWLAARLLLLNPIIVMERRGVGVFGRSFRLTRGITWKNIGVMVLFFIVAGVSVLAARFVFGAILEFAVGGDGPVSLATILTSILVGAVMTAFVVLAHAFVAKLYVAVRDAREAIVESK